MDFAYVAGVFANMFPSAPPTSDPGSSKRVQLHRGGGVHRGAHHSWTASDVPDPQSQQGTALAALPVKYLWISFFHMWLYSGSQDKHNTLWAVNLKRSHLHLVFKICFLCLLSPEADRAPEAYSKSITLKWQWFLICPPPFSFSSYKTLSHYLSSHSPW